MLWVLLLCILGHAHGVSIVPKETSIRLEPPYTGLRCQGADIHNHFVRMSASDMDGVFGECTVPGRVNDPQSIFLELRASTLEDPEDIELSFVMSVFTDKDNVTMRVTDTSAYTLYNGDVTANTKVSIVDEESRAAWTPLDTTWLRMRFEKKNDGRRVYMDIAPRGGVQWQHVGTQFLGQRASFSTRTKWSLYASSLNVDVVRVLYDIKHEPWAVPNNAEWSERVVKEFDDLKQHMEFMFRAYSQQVNITLKKVDGRLQILEDKTFHRVGWTRTGMWVLFMCFLGALYFARLKYKKMMKVHLI